MPKRKLDFLETDTDEIPADFSPAPDESAFLAYQHTRRREGKPLRPRDHAYNRSVSQFFATVIPGLPIDSDPPIAHPPLTPFAQIIEQTLKALDIKASPFLDTLAEHWPRILPPEIARDTRPGKWDNNILYVYVPTHTRLFELRRTALPTIEAALRTLAPDTPVRQIRLMMDASQF